jgi:serine/threonine-protein kinase
MNAPMSEEGSLLPSQAQQVDEACDRFEAAWKAAAAEGARPRIEEYLRGCSGPERAILLRELILVEVHYRSRRGEPLTPNEYLARFPELDPK